MQKPKLIQIKIRDLIKGYDDKGHDGVVGYKGDLDIRPPYQREFIYGEKQRDAVISSIDKGFPLNVMYWAVRDDGKFEIIDGQQRTISICQFVTLQFAAKIGNVPSKRKFTRLLDDEKKRILDYELMVYQCTGTESEKMDWFKTINIAGLKLTNQELRNAVYSGEWVTDAKKYFSKNGCIAHRLGGKYLAGRANRQEYLETAIKWISKAKKEGDIEAYMDDRDNDKNALELWRHFENVVKWVESVFPKPRNPMKGVDWGSLYEKFKDDDFDKAKQNALEAEVSKLMKDEYIKAKGGIYPFVLTRDDRYLNLRSFSDNIRTEVHEDQKGKCIKCEKKFDIEGMEADHVTPYSKGGQTTKDNCQMLCKDCNRRKSNK